MAVAGDFCDANPRATVDAGPGGLIAGPNGVTVGLFAWIAGYPIDPDGTGQQVNNSGAGVPSGFVARPGNPALITQFLADASLLVQAGFPLTLHSAGGFWVKNDGTNIALVGQKAYANNGTGKVRFGATGAPTVGGSGTVSSIAAATGTATGSISGNILTITGTTAGTVLVVGATITGNAGSAGGDAVAAGTTIVKQLTGSIGGIGTYAVSVGGQNVTSTTINGAWGVLTVGGTVTGAFTLGGVVGGTGVVAGTTIVSLGTGTGGAGTYNVSPSQAMSNSNVTENSDVETKWVAASQGRSGELVKMTSWQP